MCDEIVDASLIDEGNCFRQYYCCVAWNVDIVTVKNVDSIADEYNTAAKSNRFGTQDKPNKNVIRTWATTQEKSIQRISRPK